MLYITYTQLNKRFEQATTGGEKNAIRRQRDALHIATSGGNKKRVSEANYKKAKKVYNAFKRLNKLNDRLLILDNDERRYNSRYTALLHDEAEALEKQVKKALKAFKLQLRYYNWLASICDDNGRVIGLNYVI